MSSAFFFFWSFPAAVPRVSRITCSPSVACPWNGSVSELRLRSGLREGGAGAEQGRGFRRLARRRVGSASPRLASRWGVGSSAAALKMIKAILIFNNHGKPRLSKFYQRYVSVGGEAALGWLREKGLRPDDARNPKLPIFHFEPPGRWACHSGRGNPGNGLTGAPSSRPKARDAVGLARRRDEEVDARRAESLPRKVFVV